MVEAIHLLEDLFRSDIILGVQQAVFASHSSISVRLERRQAAQHTNRNNRALALMRDIALNQVKDALVDVVPQCLEHIVLRIVASVHCDPIPQINRRLEPNIWVPARDSRFRSGQSLRCAQVLGCPPHLLRRPWKKPDKAASEPGDMAVSGSTPGLRSVQDVTHPPRSFNAAIAARRRAYVDSSADLDKRSRMRCEKLVANGLCEEASRSCRSTRAHAGG